MMGLYFMTFYLQPQIYGSFMIAWLYYLTDFSFEERQGSKAEQLLSQEKESQQDPFGEDGVEYRISLTSEETPGFKIDSIKELNWAWSFFRKDEENENNN